MIRNTITQCICINGHYTQQADGFDNMPCSVCHQMIMWENVVDATDGGSYGSIPYGMLRSRFSQGVDTAGKHELFRIPTDEETRAMRGSR